MYGYIKAVRQQGIIPFENAPDDRSRDLVLLVATVKVTVSERLAWCHEFEMPIVCGRLAALDYCIGRKLLIGPRAMPEIEHCEEPRCPHGTDREFCAVCGVPERGEPERA